MGIKRTPGYAHPKRQGQKSGSKSEAVSENRSFASPKKKKEANEKPRRAASDTEKVAFRIGAHPPGKGEIDLFDAMKADGLSDKECVLALLRKGRNEMDALTKMSRKSIGALVYRTEGAAFETNRSMPSDQVELLRSIFDPFGAMTPRAFGLKVGEATIVLATNIGGSK